jgi:hypothetical protein
MPVCYFTAFLLHHRFRAAWSAGMGIVGSQAATGFEGCQFGPCSIRRERQPNNSLKRTVQSLRDWSCRLARSLGPLGRGLFSIPPALPSITRPTAEACGALAAAKRRAVPRCVSSQAQARASSRASARHPARHPARLISASRTKGCRSVGQAVAFWPNYSLKRTNQSLRD